MRYLLVCGLLLVFMVQGSLEKSSDVGAYVQHKINLLSLDRNNRNNDEPTKFRAIPQYDMILRCLRLTFNRTIGNQRIFSARSSSTGNVYFLIGNEIYQRSIQNEQIQTIPLARLDDITADVTDFNTEVLGTSENKTYLILSLYLEDRFQIYQILLNGYFSSIKSVQKIRRAGQTTNTFLRIHASNLYLITGYIEADIGKVAIYRWLDYHFSVEDIKDVNYHSEVVVHNQKQLVILVLQYAEYPERSINNVFIVNEQRKMIKTQEMYFLFNRLPNYHVSGHLYILRCISLGKCFLYKWNEESIFLRVSKVSFDPREVNVFGAGYNIAVMIYGDVLYFYYKQPLLKIASSYAVITRFGEIIDTRVFAKHNVSGVYIFQEPSNGKTYLEITFNEGLSAMEIFELHFKKHRSLGHDQGDQANFNALKSCISNIKEIVNVRKGWIDLIKYQITSSQYICKKISEKSLTVKNLFVFNSNVIRKILHIKGYLQIAPSTLLNIWNDIKQHFHVNRISTQKLFFTNRANEMRSNLKIHGDFFTKAATIKNVRVHQSQKQTMNRQKRDYNSLRNLQSMTINVQEIVSKGRIFTNLLRRNKINRIISVAHIRNLYSSTLYSVSHMINKFSIQAALLQKSFNNKKEGSSIFKSVILKTINVTAINGEHAKQGILHFRNFIAVKAGVEATTLHGLREVDYVVVHNMLNDIRLSEMFQQLYYKEKNPVVTGNIYLRVPSYIRNIHSLTVNGYNTNQFFDLRSNQTILGSIYLPKVYAVVLENLYVNGISVPEGVSLTSKTKFIKAAVASNFIVLGDLTLAADDQRLARHVLGTKINDFSQIYTGQVVLKGQLTINNVRVDLPNSRTFVNKLAANHNISSHFMMKHKEQAVPAFSFQHSTDIQQLVCSDLNYQPLHSYLRRNSWNTHISIEFSDAHILGNAKIFCTTSNLLHHINSEAIHRGTLSTVSGQKTFPGITQADIFVADYINNISMQDLLSENSVAFIDESKFFDKIIIEECNISLLGQVVLEKVQNGIFKKITSDTCNTRDKQKIKHIAFENVKTELLEADIIDNINAEEFVSEMNNFTIALETTAKRLKIDHLVAKVNVVSAYQIFIDSINTVNINEYFALLLYKNFIKQKEVGGTKFFSKGIVINNKVYIEQINKVDVNVVLHNTLKTSIPQNVIGSWLFKDVGSKYLTTKKINDMLIKYLLNADVMDPEINQDLSIGKITVINADGNFTPNAFSLGISKTWLNISSCVVNRTLALKHYVPKTYIIDLLLFGITDKTDIIERKVEFHGALIYFLNIWNNKKILNENCDFIDSMLDSVKLFQTKIIFHSVGRIMVNVAVQNFASFETLLQTRLLNGVDVKHLNSSIHLIGYSTSIEIHPLKFFENLLEAIQFACDDEISANMIPYHLMQPVFAGNFPKFQYRFTTPITVIGNLFIEVINNISLPKFLNSRVIKNQTISQQYEHTPQQIIGTLKFMVLNIATEYNTIHSINNIQLNDIVVQSSTEHQAILEVKNIHGMVWLLGPTSVIHCNNLNMLDTFKSSVLLYTSDLYLGNLTCKLSVFNDGITVTKNLNHIPVYIMMQLRLSAVEDLLPLIPTIRRQLSTSKILGQRKMMKSVRTPYAETLSEVPIQRKMNVNEHIPGNANTAGTITFDETCVNGIKLYNFTVRTRLSNLNWNYNTMPIKGNLVRAEWTEIDHENKKQIIIVLLTTFDEKLSLSVYVHQIYKIVPRQNFALESNAAEFQLINNNKGFVILLLNESTILPNAGSGTKLKLYYYDPNTLLFVHFKSLVGKYNIVEVVAVLHNYMVAIVEDNSNVLAIYNVETNNSTLYQKVVFDSSIKRLDVLKIQGFPALRIFTEDNKFYMYVHTSLEGWKQHSYARVTAG